MAKKIYVGGDDGLAKEVRSGYVGIDDKARKLIAGYIGVGGIARQVLGGYDPVFSNNEWADIIEACQTGNVPSTWLIGDQKPMLINGVEYNIDIIGKKHDDYSDGSGKAPITFQMHDCYATTYALNTNGTINTESWQNAIMRTTHLPAIFALLPTEVQAAIREVNKLTSAGNQSTTIITTADKLFLLSEVEVFAGVTNSVVGEGVRYEYYAAGNSRKKYIGSTATAWHLRSPRNARRFYCYVTSSGAADQATGTMERGVSFAFCF